MPMRLDSMNHADLEATIPKIIMNILNRPIEKPFMPYGMNGYFFTYTYYSPKQRGD